MSSDTRIAATIRSAAAGFAPRWRGVVAVLTVLAVPAWAQIRFTTPLQSQPGPGEVDTADTGGQIGGQQVGLQYALATLRCPNRGEVIVGLRSYRGTALAAVQVACARPVCTGRTCRWNNANWAASAGDTRGGSAATPMLCDGSSMLSGLRGRVRTVAAAGLDFDYATDLAIECSAIRAAPDGAGFVRLDAAPPSWHHPEGSIARSAAAAPGDRTSPAISCRGHGGASAISFGIAENLANRPSRVLQAVSLYCPRAQPAAQCPEDLRVQAVVPRPRPVELQWFANGGRTGGGAIAIMEALPANAAWIGQQMTETVTQDAAATTCPASIAGQACGTGGHAVFRIGDVGGNRSMILPGTNLAVTLPPAPPQSFADSHFLLDTGAGGHPGGVNALASAGVAGSCQVTCIQTFACNASPGMSYGPFTITYSLSPGQFQPLANPLLQVPVGPPEAVTRVAVTKQ